jgi:hypothetical protein
MDSQFFVSLGYLLFFKKLYLLAYLRNKLLDDVLLGVTSSDSEYLIEEEYGFLDIHVELHGDVLFQIFLTVLFRECRLQESGETLDIVDLEYLETSFETDLNLEEVTLLYRIKIIFESLYLLLKLH